MGQGWYATITTTREGGFAIKVRTLGIDLPKKVFSVRRCAASIASVCVLPHPGMLLRDNRRGFYLWWNARRGFLSSRVMLSLRRAGWCSTWIVPRSQSMASQEQSVYNGHFASTSYHLPLFNRKGDCLAAKLRPGKICTRWNDAKQNRLKPCRGKPFHFGKSCFSLNLLCLAYFSRFRSNVSRRHLRTHSVHKFLVL